MDILDIQKEIVAEFEVFDEWLDKYEYLIELGKNLPIIDEKSKTDENLIVGCQSRVWLDCRREGDLLFFSADSDAIITKGIISLLVRVFNGQKAADIVAADMSFLETIGLKENLTPTRANGLVSMINKIKSYGLAFENNGDCDGR